MFYISATSPLVEFPSLPLKPTKFSAERKQHWQQLWSKSSSTWGSYYHHWLLRSYQLIIPEGSRVLELGCGDGRLLAGLNPSVGVGVDFAPAAIERARQQYPELRFEIAAVEQLELGETNFDYLILSDLINDLEDVQTLLLLLHPYCHSGTRLIFNFYSRLWQLPLQLAQQLGKANPLLLQNWFTVADLHNLFVLTNFELLQQRSELILPLPLPGANIVNRYLARLPLLRHLCFTNLVVARPLQKSLPKQPSCSVVVAARNEEGHIEELLERFPWKALGPNPELIFVEGNSTDATFTKVQQTIQQYPQHRIRLFQQAGKGKGDAVRKGFAEATGEILMILDADMTVAPEDLPRFYEALLSGKGEFINGVRLVYPMEEEAMRFFNLVGNKFFALAFSWLLGQPIRDTLCGTKVLWKRDYERIASNRAYFGDFDPFGDFDLLFGAARLQLKILELPIRYRTRRYGETNISRWSHGWLLLRMVLFASRRLKFA